MKLALLIVLAAYALASIATIVAYGLDKRAARLGARRIPERTLHLLELLGGWPGALIAQRLFRHKTIDLPFRLVLWAIIALHALAWLGGFWLLRR